MMKLMKPAATWGLGRSGQAARLSDAILCQSSRHGALTRAQLSPLRRIASKSPFDLHRTRSDRIRTMPQNENPLNAAIALTRFGMGARPGEINIVGADPRGWLEA